MNVVRPVILRPTEGPIRIKIPYREGTRALLNRLGKRDAATWSAAKKEWSVHRRHLMPLVELLLTQWYDVTILLDVITTRKCDTRCREATGAECVCSCSYQHHSHGDWIKGWVLVGETTLINKTTTRATYRVSRDSGWRRVR